MNGCFSRQILLQVWVALCFFVEVSFSSQQKENSNKDFWNSIPFKISIYFYVTITGDLKHFLYFSLKQVFRKTNNCFKKLQYRFLVRITTTENAKFPFKIALLEANVKRKRMESIKWTNLTEQSFAKKYFIFWKYNFRIAFYKELIWCTNYKNTHIHTLCKRLNFTWECLFLVKPR